MNRTLHILSILMLLLIGVVATSYAEGGPVIKGNIYGGGQLATVDGDTKVEIISGTVEYDVYGGGALANVEGNTDVSLIGGSLNSAYGGGLGSKKGVDDATEDVEAIVGGNATVTLGKIKDKAAPSDPDVYTSSKVLGSIFGANNLNGTPKGHVFVHVLKTTPRDGQISGQYDVAAVYGGGNLAAYNPNLDSGNGGNANQFAEVLIVNCDNSIEYVYGGGNAAPVPATQVTIKGANAIDNAFAGGNGAGDGNPGADIGYLGFFSGGNATEYGTGVASINILGGTIHHVYGGSNTLGYIKDHAEVNVNAEGDCAMDVAELYGGGKSAPSKAAQININCTGVTGNIDNVYGGAHMADLTGDITLNITGGQIGNVFGGNNVSGNINGSITVNVDWTTGDDACGYNSLDNVYGGGNLAAYTAPDGQNGPIVNIKNCIINENVFGGGLGTSAVVKGNPLVTISGGTIKQDVYGGGALADVEGNTSVIISGGTSGNIYGGGLGQLASAAVGTEGEDGYVPAKEAVAAKVGNSSVRMTAGTANNIFGCNNTLGSPTGTVNVEIEGGTINNNVYGGGNLADAGTAEKKVNPVVTITGGTVTHDVYGGGALANVDGYTTVNLFGGAVGSAYGGGLGQLASDAVGTEGEDGYVPAKEAIAALVTGNTTVTLGKGVGDRDENGNYSEYTATQITGDGIFGANNINGTPQGQAYVHIIHTTPREGQAANEYDVPAVYGGGNKAAYIPTNENEFAKVLIEYCNNSIEYVYGGGNAASVPATDVKIYGANTIDKAFAGGNGAGQSTDPSAPNYNPGADVGYLGFHSTGSNEPYGSGKASIAVYGGTVHNVYGGSNTLGYIRESSNVSIANAKAGDQYDHNCPLNVDNVFGGGNEADIDGNVTITCECTEGAKIIYAGASNADVNGNVTLNLYSGAYEQVFGGNNDGGCVRGKIEVNIDETGCWPVMINELYACGNNAAYSVYGYDNDGKCIKSEGEMPDPTKKYDDPVLNIYSCTRINNIYGGGKGETATVYGNTHVNINTIKGRWAGENPKAPLILDSDGNIKTNTDEYPIEDLVGLIGNVYGGGNAAAVYGDTEVKIGTETKISHINPSYNDTETHDVNIRIVGDVYGGSKGVTGKPDTALVTGDTKVIIGK